MGSKQKNLCTAHDQRKRCGDETGSERVNEKEGEKKSAYLAHEHEKGRGNVHGPESLVNTLYIESKAAWVRGWA